MRKRISNILWGIVWLVLGLWIAGDMLGILHFSPFFEGWWTMFIIVPSALSMIEHKPRSSNIIGLCIGVFFLMSSWNLLTWGMAGRLIWPTVLIVAGAGYLIKRQRIGYQEYKQVGGGCNGAAWYGGQGSSHYRKFEDDGRNQGFGNSRESGYQNSQNDGWQQAPGGQDGYRERNDRRNEYQGQQEYRGQQTYQSYRQENYQEAPNQQNRQSYQNYAGGFQGQQPYQGQRQDPSEIHSVEKSGSGAVQNMPSFTALFSSRNVNYNGDIFDGALVNAVFGGVELDLRNAIFETDVRIDVMSLFGGIEIKVPEYVNVKVDDTPILGGVSNKARLMPMPGAPTIYIRATCILGGLEIK